jgi:uncharacterized protein
MVVPTVATNIWQALAGGQFIAMVRRFWSLLLATALAPGSAPGFWPRPMRCCWR